MTSLSAPTYCLVCSIREVSDFAFKMDIQLKCYEWNSYSHDVKIMIKPIILIIMDEIVNNFRGLVCTKPWREGTPFCQLPDQFFGSAILFSYFIIWQKSGISFSLAIFSETLWVAITYIRRSPSNFVIFSLIFLWLPKFSNDKWLKKPQWYDPSRRLSIHKLLFSSVISYCLCCQKTLFRDMTWRLGVMNEPLVKRCFHACKSDCI